MISLSLIVAMDSNRGIGKNGKLPWHLPGDMQHFKTLTTKTNHPKKQNAVIMGRKTWASIPEKFRPLPNRINLVLTRTAKPTLPPDVLYADSFEKGLSLLENAPYHEKIENLFVIGGAQIFKVALKSPFCKKLYFTQINKTFECDTFFPALEGQFKQKVVSATFEENDMPYYFSEYEKEDTAKVSP